VPGLRITVATASISGLGAITPSCPSCDPRRVVVAVHLQVTNTANRPRRATNLDVQLRGGHTGVPARRLALQPPFGGSLTGVIPPGQRARGDYLFAIDLADIRGSQVLVTSSPQPPLMFRTPW
jgi:hypothetical protein